jgi:hypothetical protein
MLVYAGKYLSETANAPTMAMVIHLGEGSVFTNFISVWLVYQGRQ